MSTKSLANIFSNRAAAGLPAVTDLVLFAPVPNTPFVTQAKSCTVAQLLTAVGAVPIPITEVVFGTGPSVTSSPLLAFDITPGPGLLIVGSAPDPLFTGDLLNMKRAYTPAGNYTDLFYSSVLDVSVSPTVAQTGASQDFNAWTVSTYITGANKTQAAVSIYALSYFDGTAVGEMTPMQAISFHGGAGVADFSTGIYASLVNISGGTVTEAYGCYASTQLGGGSTTGVWFGFYSAAVAAQATYAAAFWADEQGVFRIKADNTFNAVYQAIPALYNPQVTKYVPNAVDFERWVVQWNSNIIEIGAEKGGTGTLRAVKVIGASLQAPAYKANDGSLGIATTITTASLVGKTITVKDGLITSFA